MSDKNLVRRQKKPITSEDRQAICQMARDGVPTKEIADRFSRHRGIIWQILGKAGVRVRNRLYKLTDQQKIDICHRYRAGDTIQVLTDTYGVSYSSIHELLIRRGVQMRPTRAPKPPRLCYRCGLNAIKKRHRYCETCKPEHERESTREWRRRTIAAGICPSCSKPLGRDGSYCQECLNSFNAKNAEWKATCFAHYGSKCNCCGETTMPFLTIDHVNNDGGKRRKAKAYPGAGLGVAIYKWLVKHNFPDGYQVLCFNCQWGRRLCGTCPHQSTT